ncbi:MAG: molybdopterin-guanine dinucleotide biosynthesis protein MobB [Gammaproteobacteria bacterium]|jgi:molybdopterin-guanine dinucleotide biosynthesis protein B
MSECPVLGFAAYSGTGKTTLLKQLIPLLKEKGLSIGVIKHSHHDVELDTPGKDSYELRKAGATQTLLAGPHRWSLVTETPRQDDASFHSMLRQLDQQQLDLILVEGFRDEAITKIELHRKGIDKPFFYPHDKNIIAVATDDPGSISSGLAVLDLDNPAIIAEFILDWHNRNNPGVDHSLPL